jgi:hypothetical protein
VIIQSIAGEELEKSKSNSPEDFFTRSSVTFIAGKEQEKTLSVLYLRFFEEKLSDLTPFDSDPLFDVNGRTIHFREIVALVSLMNQPKFQDRHRIYINEEEDFTALFKGTKADELKKMVTTLLSEGHLNVPEAQHTHAE